MKLWRLHSKKCLAIFSVLAVVMTLVSVMSVPTVVAESTNLLTSDGIEDGTQSVAGYIYQTTPTASTTVPKIWDLSYPYSYGSATALSASLSPSNNTNYKQLVNGIKTNSDFVQVDYNRGADALAKRRVALFFNLGSASNLDSITVYTPSDKAHAVYDYTVYAANITDMNALATATYCVGHYTSTTVNTTATVELNNAKNVQYVLIVFNKLSSDPGSVGSGVGTNGEYGTTNLPCSYYDGTLRISEIEINGMPYVAPTVSNLLTSEGLENGTQSVAGYIYQTTPTTSTTVPKIWDLSYPYSYGSATALSASLSPSNNTNYKQLVNGIKTNSDLVQVDYNRGADALAKRRVALFFDLGSASNLDSITVYTPSDRAHAVYDYTVYAANITDMNALATETYCVGHYTTTSANTTAAVELNNAKNVQYVLIVFNKLSTDPGSVGSGVGTNGEYGTTTLPCSYYDGTLRISEIEINGTPYVAPTVSNLLTSDGIENGTQSVTGYQFATTPTASATVKTPIWDLSYPYTYGSAMELLDKDTTISPIIGTYAMLADGIYDVNEYTDTTTPSDMVQVDFGASGETALCAKAARRLALLFDLGGMCDLDSITVRADYTWRTYGIYDYTVYAGNTANVSLLTANCVGHFTNTKNEANSATTLSGATDVRYVLVVFNKLSTDPGAAGYALTEGQYGSNALSASYVDASLRLAEVEINGWASIEESVQLPAPTNEGAYINADLANAIRFESMLPTTAAPTGYSIVKYGTLVMPYQYLPGGMNPKLGAALEYGNRYVATAEVEGGTPALGDEFTVDLIGSAQGVYPGVRFATRPYVIYQKDGTNQLEIRYGEALALSVYGIARRMAQALIEQKDNLDITYVGNVTSDTTVDDIKAAKTSGTVPSLADVFAFVTEPKNLNAVAAVSPVPSK